ncbi:MAG TPA: diguanylate cyclase [Tepidisphaeraceae bacterium]|nr:diguanylate cyclase [Tepidisphaeraceae bacterium]
MLQTVLLVDDSTAIHALLRARLKDEPITIHSANSGGQGLEMAQSLNPDLILLDVDMPDPNGFEVCRRIKADERLVNTPIIFLTGAASSEQRIRGLELGAIDYITKPFDPAELRARVRAALRMKFMMDLLAKKAQIDSLTGLWNRRYFDQRLEAELSLASRTNGSLAVLMLDLDHFKSINDRFGHPTGDEVLKRVAALLVESVRVEDVVCRYGGEEFAILAPNTETGALPLAERLCAGMRAIEIPIRNELIKLTISIGVASTIGMTDRALVAQADAALYRAKENGRDRVEVASAETVPG